MAFGVQIAAIILAVYCASAKAQAPCEPQSQTESCRCSNAVTTTQTPPLRIEIHERDDPNRPNYPSYPKLPNYPRYPYFPTYRSEYPLRRSNIPEIRYIPTYSGLETPNYRTMELINAERNKDYYMMPVGA
ncbi:hypothetical protein RR46_10279 [Papilio xuthus]|uniref:Cuticular protein n=1 Tax=Papilio xuthus TaxID=66420 RepID=A0A194Q076_PAPXU|nr:hypothetical protein RR46_10279 [Papilio xuthus]